MLLCLRPGTRERGTPDLRYVDSMRGRDPITRAGKAKLRYQKISLRKSQVHLSKHFSDALLHLRNKDNESNGGVKVLCLGLLGGSEDHQKGK